MERQWNSKVNVMIEHGVSKVFCEVSFLETKELTHNHS